MRKTTRVQIEMQPDTYGKLKALVVRDEAASYAEVVRRLIRKEYFYWQKNNPEEVILLSKPKRPKPKPTKPGY